MLNLACAVWLPLKHIKNSDGVSNIKGYFLNHMSYAHFYNFSFFRNPTYKRLSQYSSKMHILAHFIING
jgi:hypothetical protein